MGSDQLENASDGGDEDLVAEVDTTNIIHTSGSRRSTRGVKIDYSQFGPDDSEDDE